MDQTERVLEYFNGRAARYLERSGRGLWDLFRQREYEAVANLLSVKRGHRLLDVGCGPGFYALRLRESYGAEVTGLDVSKNMVDEFKAHGFSGEVGDITSFQSSELFDRVLMAGVLEFVPDVEAAFRSAYKALTPGGRLVALHPRAGLAGLVYSVAHQAFGCPTYVLPSEDYKRLAAYSGFQFVEQISCTPISLAMSWVR